MNLTHQSRVLWAQVNEPKLFVWILVDDLQRKHMVKRMMIQSRKEKKMEEKPGQIVRFREMYHQAMPIEWH